MCGKMTDIIEKNIINKCYINYITLYNLRLITLNIILIEENVFFFCIELFSVCVFFWWREGV